MNNIMRFNPIALRINSFSGEYQFLSNFYPCSVEMDGVVYGSVETAFQAAKCADSHEKAMFRNYNPHQAKMAGRQCRLVSNWEQIKENVMEKLVRYKYSQNPELMFKLLATGDAELVEGNRWHDNFWGDCQCQSCSVKFGQNRLGKILMKVRRGLRYELQRMLEVKLPDGTTLFAEVNADSEHPGINLLLLHPSGKEDLLAFVEYDSKRSIPLTIAAYVDGQNDPAYYAPFF